MSEKFEGFLWVKDMLKVIYFLREWKPDVAQR